jgi:hypothetical protein
VMMLSRIGRGREMGELDEGAIESAIRWLAARADHAGAQGSLQRRAPSEPADAARG